VGEAFGFVLPEAMACGLPVVASRSGGIVEIVKDGETGLLVQPKNPEAFAEALRELVEKPELRAALGAQGVNRVAGSFTVKAVVENTMKIYDSIGLCESEACERPMH
jgi:glycosyltransferase involved in cell wall biosynthesis